MTVAATGNVLQAGFQYGANTAIKNETGKDTLEHLQEAVESQSKNHKFKKKIHKSCGEKIFAYERKVKIKLI